MAQPLIGITCGTSALDPHAKTPQDRLNQSYSRAVAKAGGIPVILSNAASPVDRNALLSRIDGLLLSGGYDVAPERFGEATWNETVEVDAVRDETELELIPAAIAQGIPILAICRGIQALNVALGGSLVQDIPTQFDASICHSQKAPRNETTHHVEVTGGSRLAGALGAERVEVNSFHHQALKAVAPELRVTAVAADGVIEGVEVEGHRFLLGVQWHPEELIDTEQSARNLFDAFIQAAVDPRRSRG